MQFNMDRLNSVYEEANRQSSDYGEANRLISVYDETNRLNRVYEWGPKNNRNLNVARELEVVARCAARCCESTQYSSSLPRGVSLG